LAQSSLVYFSIDMAYPFLNFRVSVGQQGFQIKGMSEMRWEKSVPSNLCRIAGIPVDWSSDK